MCVGTGCWSASPMIVVVMCRVPRAGRGCAGAAARRAGRARSGAEGGQDPDRAAAGGRGGSGFPRLPPSAGAQSGSTPGSGVTFLARWPCEQGDAARPATGSGNSRPGRRLLLPVEVIVATSTGSLRGWAAYFRFGNSADHFDKINGYAADAAGVVHHQAVTDAAGDSAGSCVDHGRADPARPVRPALEPSPPPDPSGTGGKGRMPAVNDVGEPCAGEPHARFDGRGLETEQGT